MATTGRAPESAAAPARLPLCGRADVATAPRESRPRSDSDVATESCIENTPASRPWRAITKAQPKLSSASPCFVKGVSLALRQEGCSTVTTSDDGDEGVALLASNGILLSPVLSKGFGADGLNPAQRLRARLAPRPPSIATKRVRPRGDANRARVPILSRWILPCSSAQTRPEYRKPPS
jgi:hypothetical protein